VKEHLTLLTEVNSFHVLLPTEGTVLAVPSYELAGGILLFVDDLVLLPVEHGFPFS
jgi:hypothetical protein